jgi:hypothetical protein
MFSVAQISVVKQTENIVLLSILVTIQRLTDALEQWPALSLRINVQPPSRVLCHGLNVKTTVVINRFQSVQFPRIVP